ncbi:MAG: Lrp/AsnC family transcriptional regulator [Clostridia bacterium]|nr:Lrp/AsnC family transcriptional regulator [Clostridia bacterium]
MKTKILKLLENNARLSSADIAKMIGESEESVLSAIGEMEADKIICGYNTIVNWDKISEEKVNALIEVKVIPQRGSGFDAIAKRIARYDEVDSVYLLSGGYDFMVQIKGKSMREVSEFVFDKLSTLETVQSTATHFVLKKYKDHGVSFAEEHSDSRETVVL